MPDFIASAPSMHAEVRRRRHRSPEPPRQPRHGLRRAIGQALIHMGERLAGDRRRTVGEAV